MSLDLATAQKIIAASHEKARELGILVTTAVVDAHGDLVALGRMEGARRLTIKIADAMAYTSASFRANGADLIKYAGSPWFDSYRMMEGGRILPASGGLLIRVGGDLMGAVGVSGGSDAQDKQCSEAALAAIG